MCFWGWPWAAIIALKLIKSCKRLQIASKGKKHDNFSGVVWSKRR